MKKLLYLMLSAFLIISCQGEDGEIGPAGAQGEQGAQGQDGKDLLEKSGYFEGMVSGVRRDGTPFNEPFKYEYEPSWFVNGFIFDNTLGKFVYTIDRRLSPDSPPYILIYCEVTNKDQADESLSLITEAYYSQPLSFNFEKELNASTLFSIQAEAFIGEKSFTYPVNPTLNNSTYKFALNESGDFGPSFFYNQSSQKNTVISTTSDGKRIYFEDLTNYEPIGDYYYGNLIKVINAYGSIGANAPYDQIVISRKTDGTIIYRDIAGLDLSSTIILPGDVFSVTNYQRNQTSGVLTFDFEVTIGVLGRTNSTKNPLTITGKFNSGKKVYNVVSRK